MIGQILSCIIYIYLLQRCYGIALPPTKVKSSNTYLSRFSDPLSIVPCSFENGLCPGYEVDMTSKLQWLLQQGPTSSKDTGPTYDRTLGRMGNGWYVYIESSNQLSGREARIQTVTLDHTRTRGRKLCLSFHYHMLGHTTGEFTVHVVTPGDGADTKYFHLEGNQNQGNWTEKQKWKYGRFGFDTPDKPFKIVFRGTTSFSYFGDIGLDDIRITEMTGGNMACDFWPTKATPPQKKKTNNPPSTNNAVPPIPFLLTNDIGNNPTCGRRKIGMGRIASGTVVKPIGKWPWMAMVQRKDQQGNYDQYCGGTLLGNEWIITAAHCIHDVTKHDHLRIRLGTHKRNSVGSKTQEVGIKGIYVHPAYNTVQKYNNDIALLHLERPAFLNTFVESVCLPRDPIRPGTKCVVTGWGKLWADGGIIPAPNADTLLEAEVQIQKYEHCKLQYGTKLTPNMVCVDGYNNFADTCPGDSGGPLMCENQDGSWSLAGITSWGHSKGCGLGQYFGVYTRMDQVHTWVKNTANNPSSAKKML